MNPKDLRQLLGRLLRVPVFALTVLALVLAAGIWRLSDSASWVDHTDRVIAATNQLHTLMLDEQTGMRGFLLTHDPAFLQPWNNAQSLIGPQFDTLLGLVSDNHMQTARIHALQEDHARWQAQSARRIAETPLENDYVDAIQSKAAMDAMRQELNTFRTEEERLRDQRYRLNRSLLHLLWVVTGVLSLITGLVIASWTRKGFRTVAGVYQQQLDDADRRQRWLNTILTGIGDAVIACDADSCVVFLNDVARQLTGWHGDTAIGHHLDEVFRIVNEETRETVESPAAKVIRLGSIVGLANHTILLGKDGTEIHIDDSGAPLLDPQGKITGIVLVFRDISERRAAEKTLAENRERLDNALAAARMVGFNIDCVTLAKTESANAAAIFGRPLPSFHELESIVHPEDLALFQEEFHSAFQASTPIDTEFRIIKPDGSIAWIHSIGKVVGQTLIGLNQDITERKLAEQAIRRSEALATQLADSMPQIVWTATPDGQVDYYNKQWYTFTGYTESDQGDHTWIPILHPDDVQPCLDSWQDSIRTGKRQEIELRYWDRTSANWRWFLARSVPTRDEQNRIIRWVGTSTDINRLKQAESAFEEIQERIRVTLKNAPIFLYTCGTDLRYNWFHRAHPDFPLETILGRRDDELFDAASAHELMSFKQGVLDSGVGARSEIRVTRGDWSQTFDATAEPLRDPAGKIVGLTIAALDVTTRAEAERERERLLAELREREQLVAVAQTATNAGFWQYWPKSGEATLTAGAARLFHLEASSRFPAQRVLERIHPDDRERVSRDLADGIASGSYLSEFRVVDDDGNVRWISGRATTLPDKNGELHMVGVNMDITTQKQLETSLLKSEKLALVGRLAATISHEINNPLEAVTNLLYLMESNETTVDEMREYARLAQAELARVSHVVTHTLRFHRQSASPTHENIAMLVDSALALYTGRIAGAEITIKRDFSPTRPINCFAGELRQLFANLIGNAADASNRFGVIHLRIREGSDPATGAPGIYIHIADTGRGMAPETITRLFEPFFTTKGDNGTGLGLWISQEIVAKHGGTIRVRSSMRPPKTGTVFSIFLPFSPKSALGASPAQTRTTLSTIQ